MLVFDNKDNENVFQAKISNNFKHDKYIIRNYHSRKTGKDTFTANAEVSKDAVDYLYHEWSNKPFGIIGVGGNGGKWAAEDLEKLLKRISMSFVGYVGLQEPWKAIKDDGSIDESYFINSIDELVKKIQK